MESTPITQERLVAFAEKFPASGNPAEYLLPYYEIDSRYDVEGKKILDVCAGGSSLTDALLKMGADAYALDLGYSNPRAFIEKIRMGFSGHHQDSSSHTTEPSEHNARGTGVLSMNFVDSIDGYPERYRPGSATSIPFPDKSFDRLFSFYGIFGVLDEEADLLDAAINEALRVLKDSGEIQIGPLLSGDLSDRGLQNQRDLLEKLKARADLRVSATEELYPSDPVGGSRQLRKLKITKVPQDTP